MISKIIHYGCGVALLFAGSAFADFSDNFSQGASNTQWLKNTDSLVMKFENGACKLTNNDTAYSAFAFHTLSTKPTTFTLSGKITLGSGTDQSAGFICCLATTGMATGYYVSIVRNEIVSVDTVGASGKGGSVFAARSAYLTTGTNELTISKKDAKFNVLCNGKFVGTFNDSKLASGSIALLVSTKTSAVFDDIQFTETFVDISQPTCFADNFNDGDLLGWDSFGTNGVAVANVANAMRITTANHQNTYRVIDLPLVNFVLKTTVTHRGGSTNNLYGLFVSGTTESTIPAVIFGINGGRNYAVSTLGQTFQLTQSTTVKGAAVIDGSDTTWFVDTLEVIKREGASEYLFVVNTDTVTRYTGVNFTITGAGVFCLDSITVSFDDFVVAEGANAICPIKMLPTTMRNIPVSLVQYNDGCRYDLLGRAFPKNSITMLPRQAAGMYLQRRGTTATIRLQSR